MGDRTTEFQAHSDLIDMSVDSLELNRTLDESVDERPGPALVASASLDSNSSNKTGDITPTPVLAPHQDPTPSALVANQEPTQPVLASHEEPAPPALVPQEDPTSPVLVPEDDPTSPVLAPEDDPTSPVLVPQEDPTSPVLVPKDDPTSPVLVPEEDPTPPAQVSEQDPTPPLLVPQEDPTSPVLVPEEDPTSPVLVPEDDPTPPLLTTLNEPTSSVQATNQEPTTPVQAPEQDPTPLQDPTPSVLATHEDPTPPSTTHKEVGGDDTSMLTAESSNLAETEVYADDLARELIHETSSVIESPTNELDIIDSCQEASGDQQMDMPERPLDEGRDDLSTDDELSDKILVNQANEPHQLQQPAEMEFTKNYSDDLLMGQNDGLNAQQRNEITSADLADYELPPYSGSSSGSEPNKQQSPVKRKSSSPSSSMAAQPSSSMQSNFEPTSMSAVKDVFVSVYSKGSHILRWRKPIQSGVVFGAGLALIVALSFYSIISVVAYSILGLLMASLLIRSYKAVLKALNKSTETPFDHLWEQALDLNVALSNEKLHDLVDTSLDTFNATILYLKKALLLEDKIAAAKLVFTSYPLTYIGAWFNGMTLITITYLAMFTVPLIYEKNKTVINQYADIATGHISMVSKRASSLAFGSSSSGATTKKQN